MAYSIDLKKISISTYKKILENQFLLPSRKILHDNIEDNFNIIMDCEVNNLFELKSTLSTTKKLNIFSEKSGLNKDYLTILRREIGSIEPKSVNITEFPEVDNNFLLVLLQNNIKTSKDYYEFYELNTDINEISIKFNIPPEKPQELFCLCDLVRINGVGAIAAKSFFEAGYKSVSEIANTKAEEMLVRVSEVNDIKKYYKSKLGTKDMQFCIDFAKIINSYCLV